MGLFSTRIEPVGYCIDDNGFFYIDKAYRDLGVKEGWLTYSGNHRNEHGTLIMRYTVS